MVNRIAMAFELWVVQGGSRVWQDEQEFQANCDGEYIIMMRHGLFL